MPRDGAEGEKSPSPDSGEFVTVGKGGKPLRPQGGLPQASAPSPTGSGSGMGGSPDPDARGGAPKSAGGSGSVRKALAEIRASRSASPAGGTAPPPESAEQRAEHMAMLDQIMAAIGDIGSRVSRLESAPASSRGPAASDSDNGSDGYSSDGSTTSEQLSESDEEPEGKSFLRVPGNLGHWNCKELEAARNQEPRRFSLHGFEPFDGLQSSAACNVCV